jgi:hypothetical protein
VAFLACLCGGSLTDTVAVGEEVGYLEVCTLMFLSSGMSPVSSKAQEGEAQ